MCLKLNQSQYSLEHPFSKLSMLDTEFFQSYIWIWRSGNNSLRAEVNNRIFITKYHEIAIAKFKFSVHHGGSEKILRGNEE